MITCPQCSTENLNGSTFCDECGAKLGSAAAAVRVASAPAPPAMPPPPQFANQSVAPKPATPFAPPPVVAAVTGQNAASAAGSGSGSLRAAEARATRIETRVEASPISLEGSAANGLNVRARLIIQRGGQIGKEFPLTESESLIGRWDADGGIIPDVD